MNHLVLLDSFLTIKAFLLFLGYISDVSINRSEVRNQLLGNSFLIDTVTKKFDSKVLVIPLFFSLSKAKI